jgi:hypothetical protein
MLNSEDDVSHKRVEEFAKTKLQQLFPYGFSKESLNEKKIL